VSFAAHQGPSHPPRSFTRHCHNWKNKYEPKVRIRDADYAKILLALRLTPLFQPAHLSPSICISCCDFFCAALSSMLEQWGKPIGPPKESALNSGQADMFLGPRQCAVPLSYLARPSRMRGLLLLLRGSLLGLCPLPCGAGLPAALPPAAGDPLYRALHSSSRGSMSL
jgi:hypothetical protein